MNLSELERLPINHAIGLPQHINILTQFVSHFVKKIPSLAHGVKVEVKGQIGANHLKLSGNLCYSVSHFCYCASPPGVNDG